MRYDFQGVLIEKRVTDLSLEEFLSYGPQREPDKVMNYPILIHLYLFHYIMFSSDIIGVIIFDDIRWANLYLEKQKRGEFSSGKLKRMTIFAHWKMCLKT